MNTALAAFMKLSLTATVIVALVWKLLGGKMSDLANIVVNLIP
ncbi:hypothetical protein [Peribacillus loiseleuriae]